MKSFQILSSSAPPALPPEKNQIHSVSEVFFNVLDSQKMHIQSFTNSLLIDLNILSWRFEHTVLEIEQTTE